MNTDTIAQIKDLNGRRALFVDGKPFLILSLQWDCDSCYSPEEMDHLLPHAAKMGCNTAALLLYWNEVEPTEGDYKLAMLEHRIVAARNAGLRLVLIWFGAYKNACLNYAPEYVKADRKRFRRASSKEGEPLDNIACPTCAETFERDRLALEQVFGKIAQLDRRENTVVLFQVENETGLLGTDRCYCAECSRRFNEGKWEERSPDRGSEVFTATCIASYVDGLAKSVKSIHPIPIYINAWLQARSRITRPGVDYPSGGPVVSVLDVYRQALSSVDFIAPDIYQHSFRDFHALCHEYSWTTNPLYVAEHSSGVGSRADRNVFYAIADHAAIGFDPWAIDRAHPHQYDAPLVHPRDDRWSEEAYALRDSYCVIRDALIPVAEAQGSERLKGFVQEEGEGGALVALDGLWVEIVYLHRNKRARGIVVRRSDNEVIVAAVGASFRFFTSDHEPLAVRTAESGRFEGERWVPYHPIRREGTNTAAPLSVIEAQVAKITFEVSNLA